MKFSICLFFLTLAPALGADLLSVATSHGCHRVVGLIRAAGLDTALKTAPSVTFFAPSDAAMERVPSEVMTQLQNNATLLAQVLKFHVLPQAARAADITNDLLLPTLADGGLKMRLNIYNSSHGHSPRTIVTAEGSPVITTDLAADNGYIHVIDKVIYPLPANSIPITMAFDPQLSSLAYMAYEATLTDKLAAAPFTVFAPSTTALNKLPGQLYNDLLMNLTRLQDLINTHVVSGVVFSSGLHNGDQLTNMQGTQLDIFEGNDGLKVNNIQVIKADIPATNGVIHIIDSVIMQN